MKITNIHLFRVIGHDPEAGTPPKYRQAIPLDVYGDGASTAPHHQAPINKHKVHADYVQIETETGHTGIFGPIEHEQVYLIRTYLRPLLIGRDALATELLYDIMLRRHRHGRTGMFMTAISAVDIALWDLRAKVFDIPLYRLLGGPTRDKAPAYASMLGYSIVPEEAAAIAEEHKHMGFQAQKWFFPYGPGNGTEGKRANLNMAHAVREAVGDDYLLMFDAFMSWDVMYTREMARGLASVNPRWVEEVIPPERVTEFARLRADVDVPIATGEHIYTRWNAKELLLAGAVDVLQVDPDWTGGITEMQKICALCSSFEVPVFPHGHSLLPALHLALSESPAVIPMVEFLLKYQPRKQFFHEKIYNPENGYVVAPSLPGLGLVLDDAKIEDRIDLTNESLHG